MAATVTYTLPIYEAVVCNLTLEKMRQKETQEKLLATILESVDLSKNVVKFFIETDFPAVNTETIEHTYVALCVLTDTARSVVPGLRNDLPAISDKYRTALAAAIDDFEANVGHLEEICEAWGIPYTDESTVTQIKQALSGLGKKKTDKEIPDWRDAIAALSD